MRIIEEKSFNFREYCEEKLEQENMCETGGVEKNIQIPSASLSLDSDTKLPLCCTNLKDKENNFYTRKLKVKEYNFYISAPYLLHFIDKRKRFKKN